MQISDKYRNKYIKLDDSLKNIVELSFKRYNFFARAYTKILKVDRTIADIDNLAEIIDRGNNSLDKLLRARGKEIESLTSTITLLEIKGLIENFGADGYQRT